MTTSRSSASSWASALAALLAVLVVTGRGSAAPAPGTLLGGGWAGARPGAGSVGFVTIRISRSGSTVHFYGDWPASCDHGRVVTATVDRIVPFRRDGSFTGSGEFRKGGSRGTFRFAGSLDSATSADGTGSAQVRSAGATCATGAIAWEARANPRVTGPPRPRAGLYFGSDDQNDPVVLRVAPGGRQLVQLGAEFALACSHAQFVFGSDVVPGAAIAADGTFAATQRYRSSPGDTRFGAGRVAHFTAALSGRFGEASVGGTLSVTVQVVDAAGRIVNTCRSRTAFAASP